MKSTLTFQKSGLDKWAQLNNSFYEKQFSVDLIMDKKNVLVFPCGSEIGLEINRSLAFSNHFMLWGASSVRDHGEFVYKNYIGSIPYYDHPEFIEKLDQIVKDFNIDIIYPAMDSIIYKLKVNEDKISTKILAPPLRTIQICNEKRKTYDFFINAINTPKIFNNINEIEEYPVFIKKNIGYGARNAFKIESQDELLTHLRKETDYIICEYLPGREYTIDCFTDYKGNLRFCMPRQRIRIMNGISVRSETDWAPNPEFIRIANIINSALIMRGAWFFQMKENRNENLTLLEIACRIGGGSSTYRPAGINLPLLSLFDYFEQDVQIDVQKLDIIRDSALSSSYQIDLEYDTVYVDYDDCLYCNDKINTELVKFLYQCVNQNKKMILLTKHKGDLYNDLKKYKVFEIWDQIILINDSDDKGSYIREPKSIFIDDSFSERKRVREKLSIPVFAPDSIEALLLERY